MNKQKRVLINYANVSYKKCQKLNTWTGKHIAGFDEVVEFGPNDVDQEFRDTHKEIFSYERGNGLWLWKPYLIYKTLNLLHNGDILVYLDSGAFWCRSAKPIFDVLEKEDIYVTALPLVEKQFTKKYTFECMGCLDIKYTESSQIQGTIIGLKKSNKSLGFIKLFLDYCTDVDNLSPDQINGIDNTFISHREDQSILSLLCKKKMIKAHKDPTQYGVLPEKYGKGEYIYCHEDTSDNYKPMIVLHRSGALEFNTCLKQWLCCMLPVKVSKKIINLK